MLLLPRAKPDQTWKRDVFRRRGNLRKAQKTGQMSSRQTGARGSSRLTGHRGHDLFRKARATVPSPQVAEGFFSSSSDFSSSPLSRYVINDMSGCLGGLGVGSAFLDCGLSVMTSTYLYINSAAASTAAAERLTSANFSLRDFISRTDRVSTSITSSVSRNVSWVNARALTAYSPKRVGSSVGKPRGQNEATAAPAARTEARIEPPPRSDEASFPSAITMPANPRTYPDFVSRPSK